LPLARFYEIALDHQIRVAVELDLQAFLELTRVITGHGGFLLGFATSFSDGKRLCYGRLAHRATRVIRADSKVKLVFYEETRNAGD
jgi:hypothetical protein